jgi:hypothetical protein
MKINIIKELSKWDIECIIDALKNENRDMESYKTSMPSEKYLWSESIRENKRRIEILKRAVK